MPYDTCETIGHSQIQHGRHSNRVYLMKLDLQDLPDIVVKLDELARSNNYTKIFTKVPASAQDDFLALGYRQEASIPGFYLGKEDAVFLCKYLDPQRAFVENADQLKDILLLAQGKAPKRPRVFTIPDDLTLIRCQPLHADEMSRIYKAVFPSYPFPIHDPEYIRKTMAENVDYFGIVKGNELIALSSAEMDIAGSNVEMTDFATLPDYRGQGLARFLLQEMEKAMIDRSIQTAYTIARAASAGMNITFAQIDYQFSGLLINNTQISGKIESMNIWHKKLN